MALCWSLDKIGPICRSVEDTALVLDAINGHDVEDPGSIAMPFAFDAGRSAKGLRLGYSPAWFESDEAIEIDRAALDAARRAGLELVALTLPDLPYATLETILDVEAAAAFEDLTLSNRDDELRLQDEAAWPNGFRAARLVSAVDFVQAERLRRAVMTVADRLFADIDAVIGSFTNGSMLVITNFTGHPSLTLRAGFVERPGRGMSPTRDAADVGGPIHRVPHGVTLCGRLFDEGTLATIGMALEAELGVAEERPPTG
jgi:Asp-tRNA(Asn)/Glu-tRNA(Gln) amidotransferase A subunit family amidase